MKFLRALLVLVIAIAAVTLAKAQQTAQPGDASLVEVSAHAAINRASPLADVADLILEAKDRVGNLRAARNGVYMGSLTRLERANLEPAKVAGAAPQSTETVHATLVPRLRRAKVVDPKRFGVHNPVESKNAVQAEVRDKKGRTVLPYRENIFPDANKLAPADLETPDLVKKLTAVERAKVDELQKRLRNLLDNVGANIAIDYAPIKNRRIITEFLNIRKETKALLDEYELRTGERTIAWTLVEPDGKGLQEPHANIPDILNPHLPTVPIQRGLAGRPWKPTPPPVKEPEPEPLRRPREQRVSVRARTFKDGRVGVVFETDTTLSKTKASPPGASIKFRVKSAMKNEEIIAQPFNLVSDQKAAAAP